ncbi:hypothetical protein G7Y89_g2858 [Cudoniella acicularis]|uniref:Uncharacterized protein n=1 Tax=Cudoniella acicularis TaxID=354080 RepID=A0A8H4RUC5_9HELO|nr:hypothetical protein G7Y89_g2858 [Cudoniella acicularis]
MRARARDHGIVFKIVEPDYDPWEFPPEYDFRDDEPFYTRHKSTSDESADEVWDGGSEASEGDSNERNEGQVGGREGLLEVYKAMQNGTIADDQIPSGWNQWSGYDRWTDRFTDTDEESATSTIEADSEPDVNIPSVYEVSPDSFYGNVEIDRLMESKWGACPEGDLDDEETAEKKEYDCCLIWANAVLDIEHLQMLPPFVKERPAVLKSIKGIILHIQYFDDGFDTPASVLKEACECISQNFDLQFISIRFDTIMSLDDKLLDSEKIQGFAKVFRDLYVRKKFEVQAKVFAQVPMVGIGGLRQAFRIARETMVEDPELVRKLVELWLPAALRE